jgi:predicted aspartyl protease
MFLIVLALICALTISGVAIFYSVIGLGAIFAAAKVPIYVMGGVLEVAKLVTASWLYQNWKNIPFLLKTYLTTAVGILMIITSLGIFGFLSKAHVEQATPAAETIAIIDRLDEQILRQQSTIDNLTAKIERLQGGGNINVNDQIAREQQIIDNADDKIKADVELIQTKISNTQKQIDDIQIDADKKIDIARTDSKESIQRLRDDADAIIVSEQNKLAQLDKAVNDVLNANKSFFNEEQEAAKLKESQKPERNQIDVKINQTQKQLAQDINAINTQTDTKIADIQGVADAQITDLRAKIDGFNAEISVLQASVAEEVALAKQRINEINTAAITAGDNAELQIRTFEQQINEAYDTIDGLNAEKFIAESKIRDLEAEVGPIKYIAQFFDADGEVDLERAVTWLIITIMFVFDPLAVLLLIAVNMSLKARYGWSFEGHGHLTAKESESLNLNKPHRVSVLEKVVEDKYKKGENNG